MTGGRDPVGQALVATPRAEFLPADQRARAGHDGPLPIGHGQTSSQPSTVEAMLRLLDVRPGHRILDVGSGSGWTTALLARLTGPTGRVLGIELEPDLCDLGRANLDRAGVPWAEIYDATPGALGLPDAAPYHRILVSAMARELPAELVSQLHTGGVLVIPVAGTMLRVSSSMRGLGITRHGSYRFVPLR
ncbi:MAG TPA: methyltransferase domain-containing protein [Nocardioides sp.]|uniref:protein-L-isoaspartate O-methyltransferase family protein n=1 Tax=Nocardioides sp. TaxID=35761 RepID=UPI002E327F61|nr:methyltransferase domain-containing protein [Nocardioides sp.]HEX3930219.1 methyltransferase domain-containing protein [Nocardioides sp.]